MKFFRDNTMNKVVVMGRRTFESLPGLLKNRQHIVLTSQDIVIPGIYIVHSKEENDVLLKNYYDDIMIIGGESIYKLFIDYADRMLLTEIDDEYINADVYFPEFHYSDWDRCVLKEEEENNIKFCHTLYTRKLIRR